MQSSVAEIVHRAAVYYYQVLLFLVSFLPVPGFVVLREEMHIRLPEAQTEMINRRPLK